MRCGALIEENEKQTQTQTQTQKQVEVEAEDEDDEDSEFGRAPHSTRNYSTTTHDVTMEMNVLQSPPRSTFIQKNNSPNGA